MIKTIYDIPEHIFKTSYQNATIGHVLTPPKLALEMIETLPSDFIKSGRKYGIKIFDPACKNGSFLFQLVIKQLDNGWMIKDIEKSLYTCDTLMASLNVAESGIKHIIRFPYQNSLIKINNLLYKYPSIEILYDELIKTITKNKYISIRTFINNLLLDRKNNWLIVKFEENLIEFIKKYEGLSKTESKLFGEVFTPQALIEEMLDTLPADVWTNKDLKWLDPAVGIGNFPAAVLQRLMSGLSSVIVDEDERRKWVLEQMIYMGDISTKNLFLLYQLFDLNNEFKLNVFRGDFLGDGFDKHMKEVWGLDGFDLVVGNPPYQDDCKSTYVQLWTKFCDKSIEISKYLLFVTPTTWMTPKIDGGKSETSNIKENIKNRATIVNTNVAYHFKDIGSTFSYYLLLDTNNNKINFNGFDINSSLLEKSIPNTISEQSLSIFDKLLSREFFKKEKSTTLVGKMIHEKELNDTNKNTYKYKVQYSDGTVKYSDSKHKLQDNIKCIFPNQTSRNYPILDLGISAPANRGACYLFSTKEEGENFLKYCKSKVIQYLIKEQRSHHGLLNTVVISSIPKLDSSKSWTDQELYEYFNLTPEEIQLIEETIQEPTKKKKSKKK